MEIPDVYKPKRVHWILFRVSHHFWTTMQKIALLPSLEGCQDSSRHTSSCSPNGSQRRVFNVSGAMKHIKTHNQNHETHDWSVRGFSLLPERVILVLIAKSYSCNSYSRSRPVTGDDVIPKPSEDTTSVAWTQCSRSSMRSSAATKTKTRDRPGKLEHLEGIRDEEQSTAHLSEMTTPIVASLHNNEDNKTTLRRGHELLKN